VVRRRGNGACQPDKLPWRPQSSQRRRHVARVHLRQLVLAVDSELSMGPFCVTRSNPTHQLTDPTQPTTSGKIWTPHPTQTNTTNNGAYSLVATFIHRTYRFPVPVRSAIKSNLTAWCNQIVSNRALNGLALSFQIFSTFAVVDPTQPKPPKTEKSRPNPTQPIGQPNPWTTLRRLLSRVSDAWLCHRQYRRANYLVYLCTTPRSTQLCIPPGFLNRVPASAGVKAGMSLLSDGS